MTPKQVAVAQVEAAATLNEYGVPPCPECGQNTFRGKTAWGRHRRYAHNILGQSHGAVQARAAARGEQTAVVGPQQCDECDRAFRTFNGLAKHKSKAHNSRIVRAEKTHGIIVGGSNGNSVTHQSSPAAAHEELALARAVGEITGLCRAIAEQEGVPTIIFTARVAEFVYRSTRRG